MTVASLVNQSHETGERKAKVAQYQCHLNERPHMKMSAYALVAMLVMHLYGCACKERQYGDFRSICDLKGTQVSAATTDVLMKANGEQYSFTLLCKDRDWSGHSINLVIPGQFIYSESNDLIRTSTYVVRVRKYDDLEGTVPQQDRSYSGYFSAGISGSVDSTWFAMPDVTSTTNDFQKLVIDVSVRSNGHLPNPTLMLSKYKNPHGVQLFLPPQMR